MLTLLIMGFVLLLPFVVNHIAQIQSFKDDLSK
jgi:hypothetical protein